MIYICSKQGKIDKLWGRFIKDLFKMQQSGIQVEYVRKGEVLLNGLRFKPMYTEKMEDWQPMGWSYPFTTKHYGFDADGTIKHLQELKNAKTAAKIAHNPTTQEEKNRLAEYGA